MLKTFAEKQEIPYPLLSDIDSEVIRQFGILNTGVSRDDAMLYGIPFPGSYVVDESGGVVAKFFHDTYKRRDSPELLIDAALGAVQLSDDAPRETRSDAGIRVTAAIHGGKASIRQGIRRHVVVRFEMDPGLHIYGEPVPEGMIPTTISVSGPPGLIVENPILPPTTPLRLESLGLELPVWSGRVDLQVPFYPNGELASETRPLDADEVALDVTVRYQACDDEACLLPKTETFSFTVPMDVIDIPSLGMHKGHGQREGKFNATPHMLRLFARKLRQHPMGLPRFVMTNLRLNREAKKRAAAERHPSDR